MVAIPSLNALLEAVFDANNVLVKDTLIITTYEAHKLWAIVKMRRIIPSGPYSKPRNQSLLLRFAVVTVLLSLL